MGFANVQKNLIPQEKSLRSPSLQSQVRVQSYAQYRCRYAPSIYSQQSNKHRLEIAMSIQEWEAVAEIISAIAVVASLVYLAVQIRQNTNGLSMSIKSTELAAFERNVEAGNRIREVFILNPDIAELYGKGLRSFKELSSSDRLRFGMVLSNIFSSLQGAYIRQLTYGNDPANFAGSERMLDSLISCRGVRDWLRCNDPDWRPQFAALVKLRIKNFENSSENLCTD